MIGKAIFVLFKVTVVVIVAAWLVTLLQAQFTCSIFPWVGPHCTDSKGEIWTLPIFTAGIGFPALIGAIFVIRAALGRL